MAKIVRKSLKVFGLTGDTADFAKFGSQEAAAPIKTKDIELIQSLEAWDKGWADAIVDANKAPYMEDMNAAMYVIGYELGYVLQEGIPEWDDGTTYYAESIVKKTATQELYASKTNDNTNNALPVKVDNTDWKYLVDLDDIQVPDLSITAAKLAANAVETAKIKDLNVTSGKLATNAVITAKINNDAVTGIKTTELLYDVHRQNNTANSVVADQTVRKGWGYILGNGSGFIQEVVSFGITFDAPPIVIVSAAGARLVSGGAPSTIDELNLGQASFANTEDITTTGFGVGLGGLTFGNTINFGYTWIAIGTKAK